MDSYRIALYAHIAAGSVALVSFWTAGLLRKGTPRHRRAGQVFLLAMLAVLASGVPLVLAMVARGHSVGALFLSFLLLLSGNGCWSAWRAVRDRQQRARYFGFVYWSLAAFTALGGLGIVALGVQTGAILLQVFGGVGVFAGVGAVRSYRRSAGDPQWWLREHFNAMIGNGVATHIAFFGIGLRNALPFVDPQLLQLLAWLLPLAGAVIAGVWLNRKYARRGAPRAKTGAPTLAVAN